MDLPSQMAAKFYDKCDDFCFEIVNFLAPLSYCLYVLQRIRFLRVCSNNSDFNNRKLFLTAKFF